MEYVLNNGQKINDILSLLKPFDTITLCEKEYREKIKINCPNITLKSNCNSTIIFDDHYNRIAPDNKELLTVRTYTVLVNADNIKFENITIINSCIDNKIYGQSVALDIQADNFVGENLTIIGGQDTLLLGPLPDDLLIRYKDLLPKDELKSGKYHQYFKNCHIEGDVDFIFGGGIAYFDNCDIISIGKGYIAAPSHAKDFPYGFVFYKCKLLSKGALDNSVFLGRPWRDYGTVAFIDCVASSHIKEEGYNNWQKSREKTARLSIYKTINYDKLASFTKILSDDDIKNYDKEIVLKA